MGVESFVIDLNAFLKVANKSIGEFPLGRCPSRGLRESYTLKPVFRIVFINRQLADFLSIQNDPLGVKDTVVFAFKNDVPTASGSDLILQEMCFMKGGGGNPIVKNGEESTNNEGNN